MALEFKVEKIYFDSTRGKVQREPFNVNFSKKIRTAQVALRSFKIGYTNSDRWLWKQMIDLDLNDIDGNVVKGNVKFLLRDSSGRIDDAYEGWVEILVIADTKE